MAAKTVCFIIAPKIGKHNGVQDRMREFDLMVTAAQKTTATSLLRKVVRAWQTPPVLKGQMLALSCHPVDFEANALALQERLSAFEKGQTLQNVSDSMKHLALPLRCYA